MAYTSYSGLIDCKENDKVYVYNKKTFPKSKEIDKDMIGIVQSIKQKIYEDWIGQEYLEYSVVIKMKNGEEIIIKDNHAKEFFRKYEFITLKDLKKKYNIEIEN